MNFWDAKVAEPDVILCPHERDYSHSILLLRSSNLHLTTLCQVIFKALKYSNNIKAEKLYSNAACFFDNFNQYKCSDGCWIFIERVIE